MQTINDTIQHTGRGFTLVETLVAVTVLIFAITGPLVLVSQSLSSANYANKQITAYYLAQEVIEVLRSIRDDNSLAGVDWLTAIPPDCFSNDFSKKCTVDSLGKTTTACLTGTCGKLQYSELNKVYRQGQTGADWLDTIYIRELSLRSVSPSEVVVRVSVNWPGGTSQNFTISETMRDWK